MAGCRSPRGFTLIEMLIALATLCSLLLVLFNLYPSLLLAIHQAEQNQVALSIAQTLVEEKRGLSFDQLKGFVGPPQVLLERTIGGVSYKPTLQVSQPEPTDNKLLSIRADVVWFDNGHPRSASQELLVAEIKH